MAGGRAAVVHTAPRTIQPQGRRPCSRKFCPGTGGWRCSAARSKCAH